MVITPTIPYPNRLAEERTAAGARDVRLFAGRAGIEPALYELIEAGEILPTLAEFDRIRAALGGIEPERLYVFGLARTIGGAAPPASKPDYARIWSSVSDSGHLLVARSEATWLERNVAPDRQVDVFVNLSCGPQHTPHILLDTVAVLRTLGVNFAAGAGRLFCCGTDYRGNRDMAAAERMRAAAVKRSIDWGATRTVHLCTQCQNTFGEAERRARLDGRDLPANQQLYPFLEELLRARGDDIPWRHEVAARVLILRQDFSPLHTAASDACARVLAMVPGVSVIGPVDDELVRVADARNPVQLIFEPPLRRDDVERRRQALADLFAARGADTMSPMHHTGQQWWSRLSSPRLTVRHPLSIIADALGCAHPDRYQAACQLGDPDAILEATRPMWTSWGMPQGRARALAEAIFDPAYAVAGTTCSCGGTGGCRRGAALVEVELPAGGTATAAS